MMSEQPKQKRKQRIQRHKRCKYHHLINGSVTIKSQNKQFTRRQDYKYRRYLERQKERLKRKLNTINIQRKEHQSQKPNGINYDQYFAEISNDNNNNNIITEEINMRLLISRLTDIKMNEHENKQKIDELIGEIIEGHQDGMFSLSLIYIYSDIYILYVYTYTVITKMNGATYRKKWNAFFSTVTSETAHYHISLTKKHEYQLEVKIKNCNQNRLNNNNVNQNNNGNTNNNNNYQQSFMTQNKNGNQDSFMKENKNDNNKCNM